MVGVRCRRCARRLGLRWARGVWCARAGVCAFGLTCMVRVAHGRGQGRAGPEEGLWSGPGSPALFPAASGASLPASSAVSSRGRPSPLRRSSRGFGVVGGADIPLCAPPCLLDLVEKGVGRGGRAGARRGTGAAAEFCCASGGTRRASPGRGRPGRGGRGRADSCAGIAAPTSRPCRPRAGARAGGRGPDPHPGRRRRGPSPQLISAPAAESCAAERPEPCAASAQRTGRLGTGHQELRTADSDGCAPAQGVLCGLRSQQLRRLACLLPAVRALVCPQLRPGLRMAGLTCMVRAHSEGAGRHYMDGQRAPVGASWLRAYVAVRRPADHGTRVPCSYG